MKETKICQQKTYLRRKATCNLPNRRERLLGETTMEWEKVEANRLMLFMNFVKKWLTAEAKITTTSNIVLSV